MPFVHRYCLTLVPHTANLLAADRNLCGSRNILWSQRPAPTGYSIHFLQPEDNVKKRFQPGVRPPRRSPTDDLVADA
jgi:hypothetical protein